jgi:DNA polymerase-1
VSTNIFQRIAQRYIVPAKAAARAAGVFDIESDGLLATATKIHCIVIADSDRVYEYGPKQIHAGLKHLTRFDYLIGHNVTIFDLPLVQRLHDWAPKSDCRIVDTLIAGRLILPHVSDLDDQAAAMGDPALGKLRGRYSIEAWGARFGMPKVGADIEDWSAWTPEMQARCVGDVAICKRLWQFLQPNGYSQYALELEHRVAPLCDEIAAAGMYFDSAAAERLRQQWTTRRAALEAQLRKQFPDTNLNSRPQIGALLEDRGWIPESRTEKTNQPKIDDETLESIAALYPEFAGLSEHYILGRRLGQLVNGKKAWMKSVGADGRIHGGIVHIGTPHSRAKHLEPNLAQVPNPKRGTPFATECRSLFKARDDWVLVACDQATLQDRGFAHYLTEFDGGAYGREFLAGMDTHWRTATALGLVNHERNKESEFDTVIREGSKSFRYAFLYGAGVPRAGMIVANIIRAAHRINPGSDLRQRFFGGQTHPKESAIKRVGKQSRDKFEAATPGLRQLRNKLQAFAQRHGWLPGLDGRRVPVRALYSALNFIVTSSEATICKRWLVRTYDELCAKFHYGWDGDVVICLWVHDEIVCCCRPEIAAQVGAIMVRNAKEPAEFYRFKVPLDADFKISANWGGGDSTSEQSADAFPPAETPSTAPDLPGDEAEERDDVVDNDDQSDEAVVIEAPIPGLEEAIADVRAFIAAIATGTAPLGGEKSPNAPRAGNGYAGNGFDYRSDRESDYPAGEQPRGAQAKSYVYKDARGRLYMRVIRTTGKSFPTQHWSNGRWNTGWPTTVIPYRLPELLAAPASEPVWLCEGEKDTDNVTALGLIATTNPGGAKNWQPELAQWFKGKEVVYIVEDNDDPGRARTKQILDALRDIVPLIAVISFQELKEKGDVSDWLEQGGNKKLLLARAEQARKKGEQYRNYIVTNLISVTPRSIRWLWLNNLARGALELLAGMPSVGKSQIQCQYVACATTGRDWPDGAPGIIPCNVIMLTAEDNTDNTLVPRLIAAGADLGRIKELKAIRRNGREELFLLGEDLAVLEQLIRDWGNVGLVTIDPITSYMGHAKNFDSHRATDVRSQLSPLKVLAERTDVAISAVTHPAKNASQRALDHFIGSQAFIAAARLGHLCVEEMEEGENGKKQPTGRRLFTDAKPGIKARQPTLVYRVEVVDTNCLDPDTNLPIKAPVIRWEGESELTADEAIAASKPTKSAYGEVREFLREILAAGPVSVKIIVERGDERKFSYDQLKRGKRLLNVTAYKQSMNGPWMWALPQHVPDNAETEDK